MAIHLDRAGRLAAMGIDDQMAATLREMRPLMSEHIDAALDAAFDRFLRFPEVAKLYTADGLAEAKRNQRKHWLDVTLSAAFGEDRLQEAVEMGRQRQRGGFGLRWYFVFFATVLEKLTAAAILAYRKNPEKQSRAVAALTKVAEFDLEVFVLGYQDAAETAVAERIGRSTEAFEQAARGMASEDASVASQLERAAQSLVSSTKQATDQASAARAVSEEAGHNIETAAAATEELSSSIHEIGRQVTQSTEIAGAAVEEAGRTNTLVQGLEEKARKIGDVVKLINDIASQTNLLALNATIEAARAGDAGKGFAVVAGEVKSLANQTAKATDEISAQIAAVQSATKDAVSAIQGIGSTIGRISEITSAIAAAVEEQGAATQEIARNVQMASRSGGALTANIASVGAATGSIGQTAGEVMAAAGDLSRRSGRLTGEVTAFLGKIRGEHPAH